MAEQAAPATNNSVSVVIPAYRAAKTIERAIGSALAQTLRPMEIIVVDDGSDDDTADIATDLLSGAVHVKFQVLVQGNIGAGAARNRGISVATADYVAFLDADDEWLPEKLERSLERLHAENADMVSHDILRMEGGSESYVDCTRHFLNRRDPFADYVLRGYVSTSTVVAKRSLLLSSGGFDPSLRSGQDYELWLSIIARRDVRHVVFPMALMRYHVTPNSITSQVERRRQAALRILFRHLPALADRCETPRRVAVFRVVIIAVQAAAAHKRAGVYLAGFGAFLRIPIHVLSALTSRYDGHYDRPDFIRDTENLVTERIEQKPRNDFERDETGNPFLSTRQKAESATDIGQDRNRSWWETKPMTYADWGAEGRLPKTAEDTKSIEQTILNTSPFLRGELDWTQFDGLSVLDIGCGSGALATRIAKHGGRTTAVDLTQTAVDLAKLNAAEQGLDIRVVRSDAENLPFDDGSFDFVFSWGVLHHTETFENALKQVNRVLKRGGRSLIMVYYRNSVVYYLHGLYWLIFKGYLFRGFTIRNVQDLYTDGYYHRYFSKAEMRDCLVDAGLAPRKMLVTQYEKKILPGIPAGLDRFLKRRFGMCLVAMFEKPS